jgi:hypothetical protein
VIVFFNEGPSHFLRRSLVFFSLIVILLTPPSGAVEAQKALLPQRKTEGSAELSDKRLIEEALSFFEAEEDEAAFSQLASQIMKSGLKDIAIFAKISSFYLRKKERLALNAFFEELSRAFKCKTVSRDEPICLQLGRLWNSNLDSIYFFEDSAAKSERLRRLLLAKDCSSAQAVLKELEAREGLLFSLLEAELKISECLADIVLQDRLRVRLEELRLFPSDL